MIGSLGLSISVCCQWMFLYQRFRFIDFKVPDIKRVNLLTYLLGCISALGCMGVGAFQWVNAEPIHDICADGTFIGFNIYLLINTWYIDPRIKKADAQYKIGLYRRLISLSGPICFVLMFSVRTIFAASIFEIVLVVGFILWLLTYIGSFGDTRFKIIIASTGGFEERLLDQRKPTSKEGLLNEGDSGIINS